MNPKIRKFLGGTKLGNNLEKSMKYFNESMYDDIEYYRWSIVRKEDNKFVNLSVADYELAKKINELIYEVNKLKEE